MRIRDGTLWGTCREIQEHAPGDLFTMAAMSITDIPTTTTDAAVTTRELGPDFHLAAVDLYRDIHKGIRTELFAITTCAGSINPADRTDRMALATHIESVGAVLTSHAAHEDGFIDPILREHLPALAEQVDAEHRDLEARFSRLAARSTELIDAPGNRQREGVFALYLELSGFTSRYLRHQLVEEGQIMPALDRLLGPAQCGALHGAIVGSIPPDELARSLAFMLPAMNAFDRLEMLEGIRMAAPAEAFTAIVGLAHSVLQSADFQLLSSGLGLS